MLKTKRRDFLISHETLKSSSIQYVSIHNKVQNSSS